MAKDRVANLYNPHEQSKEQLIESFVVRRHIFQKLFRELKTAPMQYPEQHYLIEGQRGSGKTTLLLRLSYEIEHDAALNTWLIPLVFKEEAYYGIFTLAQLWIMTAQLLEDSDTAFAGLSELMEAAYDDKHDYERICFEILINALERCNKKIVLFIDNLVELFRHFGVSSDKESQRLREVLMTCPHLRVIGATAVTLEAFFGYEHAFYEFFKKIRLEGLNQDETHTLLLELAKANNEEEHIRKIITQQPGRVESLRLLAGGVIRTLVLLFEIFMDNQNGNAMTDLEQILDRVTPLYKHRMDDLAPQQREIVNVIALNWDAISLKDIAWKTRRTVDAVYASVNELEKVFLIQRVTSDTQQHLYYVRERFFNIWYLMRVAPRRSQTKVVWLVRFLESWYSPAELHRRAMQHIQAVTKGDFYPKAAYYLTEALARTGQLELETEHQMKTATRQLLLERDKSLAEELSPSDQELFEEAVIFYQNKDYHKALRGLLAINNKSGQINFNIGVLYADEFKDYQKAEQYYLMAVAHDSANAMFNLGSLYANEFKDYQKAEQYYLMAIAHNDADAMNNLGLLYANEFKDYQKAEQYYLMAIAHDSADAMNNLGSLYANEFKDYQKAEQYYLMAIAHNDAGAMNNLGLLYANEFKDYQKAEQYYLMAIAHNDADAMNNLGLLYANEFKDYQKAEQYYLMAVAHDSANAMFNLGSLYANEFKDYQKAEQYYLMAIAHNDAGAMNNLGVLYANEFKDYQKAEQYYLMAVAHDSANAMFNLGSLYANEFKDYQKAEQYYLMAVAHDSANAMFNLGSLYANEFKDYQKAEQYYLMAVAHDSANAMFNLGSLYANEFKDYQKAEQYYLMAIVHNDADAMNNLGVLYENELKDYQKAEQYYLMAIAHNDADAMNNLAFLYFEKNWKKHEALKYAHLAVENMKDNNNIYTLACVYIWNNEIENALQIAEAFMNDAKFYEAHEESIILYLMLLLSKKRYADVAEYFEMTDMDFKERCKPLYYALLYFLEDKNYHKLPPELAEPVQDIIKRVKQMAVDYA